jgi:prolyl-tRNA editing enzyme YbaK/EbsC (Cys-tRNA(Pro) deacylase)
VADYRTLVVARGDDANVVIPVTRGGQEVDLQNAKVWFTVKRRTTDPYEAAVVAKTYGVAGGPGGITLSVGRSYQSVIVAAIAAADTEGIAATTRLVWDARIEEPGVGRTRVAYGTLAVPLDVSTAA